VNVLARHARGGSLFISTDIEATGDSSDMGKSVTRSVVRWVCSGCGSGHAMKAPGTCGSVAALIFWWLLFDLEIVSSLTEQLMLIVVTAVVGTVAVAVALRYEHGDDPQWIVIDEWAGLFVALVGIVPAQLTEAIIAFALFRLFDATKIGPVGWAERLPRQFGIMADDLVAGALAALVLWAGEVAWMSLASPGVM